MEQALSALKILDAEKREFSTVLPARQSYFMLPHTMIVSIIDFDLFECTEFHSFFQPLKVTRHSNPTMKPEESRRYHGIGGLLIAYGIEQGIG